MDDLTKAIEALVPSNLDNIIRKNRDQVKLMRTSDEEIMELYSNVDIGEPKEILDNWSLISLITINEDNTQVFLLGDVRGKDKHRLTSPVLKIDLDKHLLTTQSESLYQLGKPQVGEHDIGQLMAICAVFHLWGFGDYLGIPHFYY